MTFDGPDPDCGGCRGAGAHRRFCRALHGRPAFQAYRQSQAAGSLADWVGSNEPGAANHLYAASGALYALAEWRSREWQAGHSRLVLADGEQGVADWAEVDGGADVGPERGNPN